MSNENERNTALNKIADLLTDMTFNGATQDELKRAILYSADVVRAEKHDVNWKQSYEDYVIAELENKYGRSDSKDYDKPYEEKINDSMPECL